MRNTLWGAIYRVATLIGPFAIKTIIIKELGQEYNGLSTLFTSVLTVLNLANLGFNSSLVFTMYKAIAEDDKPALCAMLKFYRKVYRIVGLVILGMGLAVMPFLPWLVKNECPPDVNLYVLFAIYLSESVLDYLMFAYNNATFTAFQRNDVTLKISTVRYVVQYTLQAAVLLIFSNYYAYIILLPLMVIPNNVAVYLAARKHYPDIVCQGELDPVTKKDIYKRVGTLFGHKLGNTFLVSIDSIIISSFLGLTALSLYSNYYYILPAVNGLVEIVTNGSLSGIGNKLLTDSREDNYRFFKTMTYGWVALVGGALGIKPVLALQDGAIKLVDKGRGRPGALVAMFKQLDALGGVDPRYGYTLLYSDNKQLIAPVHHYMHQNLQLTGGRVAQLGPTIGTHVGPGVVGVVFVAKE